MLGSSGARTISFQDLFARPPPPPPLLSSSSPSSSSQDPADAATTAAYSNGRAPLPRPTASAPTTHTDMSARVTPARDAAHSGQLLLLPSRRTQKNSLGFILGGLPQDRAGGVLPPPRQAVVVKCEPEHTREPAGGGSAHHDYAARSTFNQPYGHYASRRQESDGSSSDSYEGLPAPRETLRLPSIVPSSHSTNRSSSHHHHYHQQQQQEEQELLPQPHQGSSRATETQSEAVGGKRKKKRKARICKEQDCDKYVVDHGLCIRHGGGKRCNVEDCNCRAQNRGLCWKHGGYTICKIDGCTKRAKSRGICWSHGGGTRCKTEGCSKIAVSLGRCWAHGGGKRCSVDGCKKPASERTNNYCADHFGWFQQESGV